MRHQTRLLLFVLFFAVTISYQNCSNSSNIEIYGTAPAIEPENASALESERSINVPGFTRLSIINSVNNPDAALLQAMSSADACELTITYNFHLSNGTPMSDEYQSPEFDQACLDNEVIEILLAHNDDVVLDVRMDYLDLTDPDDPVIITSLGGSTQMTLSASENTVQVGLDEI